MRVGYARVSTQDQDLSLQEVDLKAAGCKKIFRDKASGKRSSPRPGLDSLLEFIREGDTLVVWKLDRLGRSTLELLQLSEILRERKIEIFFIKDGIDTGTSSGRLYFKIMAALAERERETICERTNAGLAIARQAGRVGGRPRINEQRIEAARKLLAAKMPVRDVAEAIGISKASIWRYFPASEREALRASS